MRILLDSSVLVAAMIASHPDHERGLPWLAACRQGRHEGVVAQHSLAELYSTLTSLPLRPRLVPLEVAQFLEENVEAACAVQELRASDYRRVIGRLSRAGFGGGIIYDALIAEAAIKAKVARIITFNQRDFERLPWLDEAGITVAV